MAKEPVRVLVMAAAGRTGCALVHMIGKGQMLGEDQPVILHLLETPSANGLEFLKDQLIDAALPLLKGVVATTDNIEACSGVNIAIMLRSFTSVYQSRVAALDKHAAPNCKFLFAADFSPVNLKESTPSISEKNITFLTRLEHNRAVAQLSERLNMPVSDIRNVIMWGRYASSTLSPDVSHAVVQTSSGEKLVRELINDKDWLNGEFITKVREREATIRQARGLSSAISYASSICDHIRDWVLGTPEGTFVSMGVYSDGSYNFPKGSIYSFPVTCLNGEWTIVQGLYSEIDVGEG